MSNKTYAKNVDVLRDFGFDYVKWPKSSKAVDAIVWTPCVAKDVNADFPDQWANVISADGKEIYEMIPKGDAAALAKQTSEKNKKCLRIVFAHMITSVTPCKGAMRRYRFIGLFKFDRSDAKGVHYKRLEF